MENSAVLSFFKRILATFMSLLMLLPWFSEPQEPTPEPDPGIVTASEWVSTWSTAEEKCDVNADRMPQMALKGTTVRQAIRITSSSDSFRLTFSNEFGKEDVVFGAVHIAKQLKPGSASIVSGTDTAVTVGGNTRFTVKAGQKITTDPVSFSAQALDILSVSMYFEEAPTSSVTGHRGARAATFQISGNMVSAEQWNESSAKKTLSWFFLCDVSAYVPEGGKAVVCFGDSITDGYGTDASYLGRSPDSYTRWTDYFAERLKANAATENITVLNEGIGANSLLGSYPTQAGRDRFARDLLEHDGVAYVIILFGVNDLEKLSSTEKVATMKTEFAKMIGLAHENGIKVYAAPILPFGTSSYYSEASEQARQMLNAWFRSEESGVDAIIDFESAVADPDNPQNIAEKYTHGDGLHPYDGYKQMAETIDLSLFTD